MSGYHQKLVILCPSTLATKYGAIADLFDSDGNLVLLVPMANYARVTEGDGSKLYDYFKGVGVAVSPKRVGFNVTVTDSRFEILLALEELSALSLSSGYDKYTPITIRDYVRLEWQDYAQGYTERIGKIEGIEDGSGGGGTVRRGYRQCDSTEVPDGDARYGGGFRFRFLEKQMRLVT